MKLALPVASMREKRNKMDDVQNRPDERGIALDRAGVSGLRYPITVWDKKDGKQKTVANFSM